MNSTIIDDAEEASITLAAICEMAETDGRGTGLSHTFVGK